MKTITIGGVIFPKDEIDEIKLFVKNLDFIELMIIGKDCAIKLPNDDISIAFLKAIEVEDNYNAIVASDLAKILIVLVNTMQRKEYIKHFLEHCSREETSIAEAYDYAFWQSRSYIKPFEKDDFAFWSCDMLDYYEKGYSDGLAINATLKQKK